MAKEYIGTYIVFKVYRKSGRRQIIERDLTDSQATRLVESFPSSKNSMVCRDKQFTADKYFKEV